MKPDDSRLNGPSAEQLNRAAAKKAVIERLAPVIVGDGSIEDRLRVVPAILRAIVDYIDSVSTGHAMDERTSMSWTLSVLVGESEKILDESEKILESIRLQVSSAYASLEKLDDLR